MVSLGPQQVQLIKGWRYLLSAGSYISLMQSSQIAMSGEMKISPLVFSLSMMEKAS